MNTLKPLNWGEVRDFLIDLKKEDPKMSINDIADRITDRFGIPSDVMDEEMVKSLLTPMIGELFKLNKEGIWDITEDQIKTFIENVSFKLCQHFASVPVEVEWPKEIAHSDSCDSRHYLQYDSAYMKHKGEKLCNCGANDYNEGIKACRYEFNKAKDRGRG